MYIDSGVYNKAGVFLKDQSYVDDEVMDDVFVSLDGKTLNVKDSSPRGTAGYGIGDIF